MNALGIAAAADPPPADLAAFQERYALNRTTIAGHEWRFRRTTSGAPVLLALPGALGTGDVFFRTAKHFAGRFDVVTVAYPAVDNIPELTSGLAALLNHFGADPVIVVGSSLGGYLAQQLALDHVVRIELLVLGNTFRNPGDQQARWPAADVFAQKPAEAVLQEARTRLVSSPAGSEPEKELRAALLALVGTEQDADRVKAQRLTVLRAATLPPVGLPPERIGLVDDDDDPVITPGTREDMRRTYAASRHERIAGGGHYPSILAPERYHRALDVLLGKPPC